MAELLRGLFQPLFRDPLPSPSAYTKGGGRSALQILQSVFNDGNARRGYAFAPWMLDTLFVERTGAAATTPAGVGDFVGTIRDVSGNGWYATATADSKRGVLTLDGSGNYYIATDGIDDSYRIANLILDTTQYEFSAFNQTNVAKPFFCEHGPNGGTSGGHYFFGTSSNAWSMYRSGGVHRANSTPAGWANGLNVLERSYLAGSTGTYLKNGVLQTDVLFGTARPSEDVTAQMNLFSRNQTSIFSEGAWYGSLLCDKSIPTSDQIMDIRTLFARKSGITL